MRREYDVLKVYSSLLLVSAIYTFIMDMTTGKFYGAIPAGVFNPSKFEWFVAFVIHVVPILMIFPVFRHTKDIKYRIRIKGLSNEVWYFDERKIHILMSIIMMVNLVFALRTGIGRADSIERSSLSFLLRIIPPEPMMLLYFVFCHNTKKRKHFWINFVLFALYQFATGWTGFLLQYGFIELFFIVKYSKKLKSSFPILKLGILCDVCLVTLGGVLYSFLRPLKYAVRYGYGYTGKTSITEGMANLVNRLTNYESTVISIINHTKIANIYQRQRIWHWEATSVFKNVLPRFIMPNKDYRVLGNILVNSYYPDITTATSTGYSIITYAWNLLESSLPGFIIWIILYIFMFIICKKIIELFEDGSRDSEILYFILVMEVLQGTPINVSLGATYLELIYALLLLPIMGIIKKRSRYMNVDLI